MPVLVWRVAGVCVFGIWVYLALFRAGFWKLRERLTAGRPREGHSVIAVVPARDEGELIGCAVASLHAQRGMPRLRVIVADDESSDNTAIISNADQVVRVPPRPSGWKGKLWAMACGIEAASAPATGGMPEFYLLTDADIEHVSPDMLASLVTQAERGFDLVSVMVQLRCESLVEQFLIPSFVFFFFMLYPPGLVAEGKGIAAAAGGCMLIRRETLERIGGIASIREALIDDCTLATRVKASGGRVWLGISDLPIRSVRPYDGISGIRGMIARSAFAQLRHSAVLLVGTVFAMLLTYLAPPMLLLSRDLPAAALGAAAWCLSAMLYFRTVRLYGAPVWTAFCLPVIALFYLAATVESAVLYWSGRGGQWKGRTQDASA
jgi:hopene-associated glycosyltransferase HpnB